MDAETRGFISAKSWRLLLAASTVIWIIAFTGWKVLTGFRFSNSFLKPSSLPPSPPPPSISLLPPSLLSLCHPCFHLCCAVQSVCLQLMGILAATSFHPAELLGFVCYFSCFFIEAVPAAVHAPLCVCMLLGVIRLIAIDWLYCGLYLFYWFSLFSDPPPRAREAREDVHIFVQKLSIVALVVHGAVRLWGVGHQHQSAASRRVVEEALWPTVCQVVPQVRLRNDFF